eukprot:TRINITY_DN89550_c0_g1_i1.p5 TRINITY_DN89550_c0_g1~~TRINITY_DN89550_c0_g1_i1.p5  ORF type:complete len:103 (+),score=0.29 TRINITY_DN89550_c0_g1_i1:473-781(+)
MFLSLSPTKYSYYNIQIFLPIFFLIKQQIRYLHLEHVVCFCPLIVYSWNIFSCLGCKQGGAGRCYPHQVSQNRKQVSVNSSLQDINVGNINIIYLRYQQQEY